MADTTPNETQNASEEEKQPTIHELLKRRVTFEDIDVPEPELTWMDKTLQWGTKVKPGSKGLTCGQGLCRRPQGPLFWLHR